MTVHQGRPHKQQPSKPVPISPDKDFAAFTEALTAWLTEMQPDPEVGITALVSCAGTAVGHTADSWDELAFEIAKAQELLIRVAMRHYVSDCSSDS